MLHAVAQQPLELKKSHSKKHHRKHHDKAGDEKQQHAHKSETHSSHHKQKQPKIKSGLTLPDGNASTSRHYDNVKMLPAVTPSTSVSQQPQLQIRSVAIATPQQVKNFVNGGRCSLCNVCNCACSNSNNPFSGCGSPFIDDGSYLETVLNQVTVPYGFVDGRDTLTFSMTAITGSLTGDIVLAPLGSLASMQAATGLSSLTQVGQTFFIGSTTANDAVIATANGLFEIVSLPTAWNSAYVIRPKTVMIAEDLRGCGCGRDDRVTTLVAGDLIKVLYAAPLVKPCVSGNNVYYAPGNQGNFVNAQIYQIAAVATTAPIIQLWTMSLTPWATILGYKRVTAAAIPNSC